MIYTDFGIKVRMSGLCINRPIVRCRGHCLIGASLVRGKVEVHMGRRGLSGFAEC